MTQPTFQAIPMLRIFDLQKAKDFYVGFLGFKIDWEHRFDDNAPVYMQVSRGDLILLSFPKTRMSLVTPRPGF